MFDYNCFGDHQIATSDVAVPTGRSVVGVRFRRDGNTAVATLVVDGAEAGSVDIPFAMRIMSSVGPSVGYDHGSPVSRSYDHEFAFEGSLERVDITLVKPATVPASIDEAAADAEADRRSTMSRQ